MPHHAVECQSLIRNVSPCGRLTVARDGDGSGVADTNVAVCAVLFGGDSALLHEFKKGKKGDNNFYFFLCCFLKIL